MRTEDEKIKQIAEQVAMRVVKIYGGGGNMSSYLQDWANKTFLSLENGGTVLGDTEFKGALTLNQENVATQKWVDDNYLSIDFFRGVFKVYAQNGEITPNNTNLLTAATNIKAMFGFWTESYISALGRGNGQAVIVNALGDLSDVNLSSPQNGQVLTYNYQTGKWVNSNMPSLTGYATQSWVQDQGYLTQHQSLAGYATQSWVNNKGYATETWVNNKGYATETWVGQNYLGINDTAAAANKLATARTIWGQSFNGTANVSGNMSSVGNITMDGSGSYRISPNGQSLYIGNSNNSGWVYLADMCSQSNTSSVTYWKIMNNGNSEFANVLSNGYVTALSDIRFKDVIDHTALSLEAIASASVIRFTWKNRHDSRVHVGGIAQEWEKILPEAVVKDADGRLSMDYGVIGMVAAVSLAREMQDQQAKIASLEERIARLESMLGL